MKFGLSDLTAIKLGGTDVTKVMLGATEMWSATPSAGPGLLAWPAPDTTGYTVINVPVGGYTSTLDHNTDYVLNMPAEPVTGSVFIKGGRNVVVIGGEISRDSITYDANGGAVESDQHGIYVIRHPTAGVHAGGRIVHIEGVLIRGYGLSDGIRTASNDGGPTDVDLRIQNCRIELGMWYRDAGLDGTGTPHPDIFQPFGGVGWVRVDGLTGLITGQGMMLKPDFNAPNQGHMSFRRMNLRENTNPDTEYNDPAATWPNPGRTPRYLWWTDGEEGDIYLETGTVWFNHPDRTFAGDNVFWPEGGTVSSDATGTYLIPVATGASQTIRDWSGVAGGKIYEGNPPDGDYVSSSAVGIGYVSPGYDSDLQPTTPDVPQADLYADFPGSSGDRISTPDAAWQHHATELDIAVFLTEQPTSGVARAVVSKFLTTGNQREFFVGLFASGTPYLWWSSDGTNGQDEGVVSGVTVDDVGTAFRQTLELAGGNYTVRLYTTSDPVDTDPDLVTWVEVGSANSGAATQTSIFDSTADLALGGLSSGSAAAHFAGGIKRVIIRGGVDGSVVEDFYPSRDAVAGTSPFASAVSGATWTPIGNASIVSSAPATGGIVASGLVAEYRLDEGSGQTIADASGNGWVGQLGSTAGADTNDPAWLPTRGLKGDGVDDYGILTAPSIGTFDGLTIMVYIDPTQSAKHTNKVDAYHSLTTQNPSTYPALVMRTFTSQPGAGYFLRMDMNLSGSVGSFNKTFPAELTGLTVLTGTYDVASSDITLYQGDTVLGSSNLGFPGVAMAGHVNRLLGREGGTYYSDMAMYYVVVYNRALSAAEVAQNRAYIESVWP